ncbi:ribosomal protein L7/L12 [Actinacidiphila yanglinensis]|uniref:non-specific serine/threonine protein kinase n=1 Tax=Actinacidiphila yanglinensis TaxID=310779 RepID=A0A1H6DZF6_9ACTN|nr:ribosomal protein L7/L12 [Actinacidiphila yanglinensis]SEG90581.1 ribosomal protein L7/L12 [Actinacidiphila yanglinensis]
MTGRLIGGRYRLLDLIAAGGFGEVWRAHDERLNALIAIKRIKIAPYTSATERAGLVARAEREARNAAALRDEPNVVAVYDVVTEDGLPWVVMRLVDGVSLAQELARRTRLEPERAAGIALGVLAALSAAHRLGIVHRDVKPANIMLAADGQVLLADFGIAKHRDDTSLTSTGMVVGTLEYMAPERFGAAPDADHPAGDLFSLGATLFETVEGISPFRRTSATAIIAAVAFEPHPPLRNAGALTALIEQLLAKNPGYRPAASDAIAALRGLSATPTTLRDATNPPTHHGRREEGEGYDVILGSAGTKKIQVIKAIRELTSLGLKEAKDLVDMAPRAVLEAVGADAAARAEAALKRAGATVTVRPVQHTWPRDPAASFDVILGSAGTKKIQVIKAIRELTSLGLKEAKDLVDKAPRAVLEAVSADAAAKAETALNHAGATVAVRPVRRTW